MQTLRAVAGIGASMLVLLTFASCCKDPRGLLDGKDNPASNSSVAGGEGGLAPLPVPRPASGILAPGEADKILAKGAPAIVRLISPGAEPRSPLRYEYVPGTTTARFAMDISSGIKAGGMPLPAMKMPRMTMSYDYVVKARDAAGSWPVSAILKDISAEGSGMIAKAMQGQFGTLKGLQIDYTVDPKGRVKELKTSMPNAPPAQSDQLMSSMRQAMQAMTAALPDEPIGPGGKWQVVTRAPDQGIDLIQFVTFTLKERRGTALRLGMDVVQLAASDVMNPPQGAPAGSAARLSSFHNNGTSDMEAETTSPMPRTGTLDLKTDLDLADSKGSRTAIDTTTKITFGR